MRVQECVQEKPVDNTLLEDLEKSLNDSIFVDFGDLGNAPRKESGGNSSIEFSKDSLNRLSNNEEE